MTITHKTHWAAFIIGALLGVEITGLALGSDPVAFWAMLAGALFGTSCIAYLIFDYYRGERRTADQL